MDKYINFEVDSAEIIDEQNESDSQFATARILAFSSGKNRHNMTCSEEVLMSTAKTLNNIPLLYNFESMFKKSDFGTHTDPERSLIAGFVVPNSQKFFKLDDGSGRTGVSVISKIWKRYAPQVMKIFEQRSVKPVSVEMELTSFEQLSNGLIDMKDFVYSGICLLGSLITEASPGANIEMLSFSTDDNNAIKQAYELEFSKKTEKYKTRYSEIDFSIPETVKNNAKRGLDVAHSNGRSGAVYMAIGNHLSKSDKVASDKIRYINKNIHSKRDSELEFMLMGGEESIEWSNVIVGQMNEKDSKMVSYFESSENKIEMEVKEKMDDVKDEDVKEESMAAETPVEEVEKEQDMAADTAKDEEKETPEEEKAESPAEEKEEEKKGIEKKMSLDSYMDVAAVMGFLVKQTEDNKVIADKYTSGELDDSELCCAMFASMCKMSEDLEKYAAENDELKKFKADIEKERFALKVESFMQEMSTELPAEEFAKAKEDSANFSMDNLDDWKNKVKVTAFNFSRGGKEKKKQDFVSIAMPFVGNQQSNSGETKSPWIRK